MRIAIIALALVLAGCATLDDITGMTLEERCEKRRAAIAGWDQLERDGVLTEASRKERAAYRYYVATVCPPVQ